MTSLYCALMWSGRELKPIGLQRVLIQVGRIVCLSVSFCVVDRVKLLFSFGGVFLHGVEHGERQALTYLLQSLAGLASISAVSLGVGGVVLPLLAVGAPYGSPACGVAYEHHDGYDGSRAQQWREFA